VTVIAQRQGDAVRTLNEFPLSARLGNAVTSYVLYLEKLIWPFDLAVFYPHPGIPSAWAMAAALLLLASITGLVLWQARQRPSLVVGWLWFVGTLFPVSGVMQAGWQGMADRFAYFPSIGLFILFTWEARGLLTQVTSSRRLAAGKLQLILSLLVLGLLSLRTANQIATWQDSLTLWEHAREVTPDNFYTRFSYGAALLDAGRVEEAAQNFARSVELKPDHPFGHYELGLARLAQGRREEAAACWEIALRLAPNYALARQQLDQLRQ